MQTNRCEPKHQFFIDNSSRLFPIPFHTLLLQQKEGLECLHFGKLDFSDAFFWMEHLQRKPDLYGVVNQQFNGGTVDGRNPAPVDMENVHNFLNRVW